MHDKIIIIGGGLLGVSTFYELAAHAQKMGKKVLLLERGETLAPPTAASHANGGVLHPSVANVWNAFGNWRGLRVGVRQIPNLLGWGAKFLRGATPAHYWQASLDNYQLAAYSTAATRELVAELSLEIEQRDVGMIKIFANENQLKNNIAFAERLKKFGLEFDVPDAETLATREPALTKNMTLIKHTIHFKGDMVADARKFILQLAAVAEQKGGELRCNAAVAKILTRDAEAVGVQLANGEIINGAVVVANGHAAAGLLHPLKLRLALRPVKGYSLSFDAPQETLPRYPLVDDTRHIAITPFRDRIRVLGMAEFAGTDLRVPPARQRHLQEFLHAIYPDLPLRNAKAWAGLRPMSADGRPFIGATPIRNLWLNAGHGHLGWTQAVGSARILADQISHTTPEINPQPFSPTR